MGTDPQIDLDLVARYLVTGERVVIAVRRHWVTVVEPVASAVAGLALVLWVGSTVPQDLVVVADFLWWVWFAVLGRALFLLWEWRRTWFVGTDRRLLLTYGVVVRRVAMMPLSKVTDMNYGRTLLGRLLGYGTFTMESAGQNQALSEIEYVPSPDHHYRALVAQIFGGEQGEGDPLMQDEVDDDAPQWDDELPDTGDPDEAWDDPEREDDALDAWDELWDEDPRDRRRT